MSASKFKFPKTDSLNLFVVNSRMKKLDSPRENSFANFKKVLHFKGKGQPENETMSVVLGRRKYCWTSSSKLSFRFFEFFPSKIACLIKISSIFFSFWSISFFFSMKLKFQSNTNLTDLSKNQSFPESMKFTNSLKIIETQTNSNSTEPNQNARKGLLWLNLNRISNEKKSFEIFVFFHHQPFSKMAEFWAVSDEKKITH